MYARNGSHIWMIILICVLAVVVGIASACLALFNGSQIRIALNGPETIVLEYGTAYQDAGASASYHGQVIHNKTLSQPKVIGEVKDAVLGEYVITYRAQILWKVAEVSRTIRIVDTQAPTIELMTDPDTITLPGTEYIEEGYTARDNYDGVITHLVVRAVEGDVIVYTVRDSSGNETVVRRPISYTDHEAPKLTLTGSDVITIQAGQSFQDPGCTAIDNVDGDISHKVQIVSTYDIYTPGTYTLVYEVTDSYGNKSEAKRILVVESVQQPSNPDPTDKVIYLTFDDGPTAHTARLLQILQKYNVKATFFVVNTDYISLTKDIAAAGHTVAIHTYTHKYDKVYASDEAYFEDLNLINEQIYKYTGKYASILRFPGGSSNTISKRYSKGIMTRLTKAVEEKGFHYFDWNVDSDDAGNAKTADEVFNNVINGVKKRNSSIVLQHDTQSFSVDAVERIIVWGLANGYTFLPLTENSPTVHHSVNN